MSGKSHAGATATADDAFVSVLQIKMKIAFLFSHFHEKGNSLDELLLVCLNRQLD